MHALMLRLSRALGALVCRLRGGHRFYIPPVVCSWQAHACVRCGEPDQPLDTLPPAPSDEDGFGWLADEPDYFDQREALRARRWLPFLPFPRWL